MQNACSSDSRCGLACDARTRDAKSLAMRVERCEPLRSLLFVDLVRISRGSSHYFRESLFFIWKVVSATSKQVREIWDHYGMQPVKPDYHSTVHYLPSHGFSSETEHMSFGAPNLEKKQSRLTFSATIENFNLTWTIKSWPSEFKRNGKTKEARKTKKARIGGSGIFLAKIGLRIAWRDFGDWGSPKAAGKCVGIYSKILLGWP